MDLKPEHIKVWRESVGQEELEGEEMGGVFDQNIYMYENFKFQKAFRNKIIQTDEGEILS